MEKEERDRKASRRACGFLNSSEVIVQEIKIKLIVLNAPEISENHN